MTHWKKDEVTLTPKTRVPLYVVGSSVTLAIYMTAWFFRFDYEIANSVTRDQFQQWKDEAWNQNRVAYPAMVWPPIPPKQAATMVPMPTVATTSVTRDPN